MCCAGGFHTFAMFVLCLCLCEANRLGTLKSNDATGTINLPKKLRDVCVKVLFNLLKKFLFCVFFNFLAAVMSLDHNVPNWRGWCKMSKLTNHTVYQELVYRNDVLKTMLTGSTYPSPQLHHGFWANFLDAPSPLSWSLEQVKERGTLLIYSLLFCKLQPHIILPLLKKGAYCTSIWNNS